MSKEQAYEILDKKVAELEIELKNLKKSNESTLLMLKSMIIADCEGSIVHGRGGYVKYINNSLSKQKAEKQKPQATEREVIEAIMHIEGCSLSRAADLYKMNYTDEGKNENS